MTATPSASPTALVSRPGGARPTWRPSKPAAGYRPRRRGGRAHRAAEPGLAGEGPERAVPMPPGRPDGPQHDGDGGDPGHHGHLAQGQGRQLGVAQQRSPTTTAGARPSGRGRAPGRRPPPRSRDVGEEHEHHLPRSRRRPSACRPGGSARAMRSATRTAAVATARRASKVPAPYSVAARRISGFDPALTLLPGLQQGQDGRRDRPRPDRHGRPRTRGRARVVQPELEHEAVAEHPLVPHHRRRLGVDPYLARAVERERPCAHAPGHAHDREPPPAERDRVAQAHVQRVRQARSTTTPPLGLSQWASVTRGWSTGEPPGRALPR